jgi:hypothetical protein
MSRRQTQFKPGVSAVLVSLAAALLASGAAAGVTSATATPAKTVAERRVLSALGRNWRPSTLPEFVSRRTRLPLDNVHASCERPKTGRARLSRFICVVRPGDRRSKVRLYLSYVSLRAGDFRIHWLDLRGR